MFSTTQARQFNGETATVSPTSSTYTMAPRSLTATVAAKDDLSAATSSNTARSRSPGYHRRRRCPTGVAARRRPRWRSSPRSGHRGLAGPGRGPSGTDSTSVPSGYLAWDSTATAAWTRAGSGPWIYLLPEPARLPPVRDNHGTRHTPISLWSWTRDCRPRVDRRESDPSRRWSGAAGKYDLEFDLSDAERAWRVSSQGTSGGRLIKRPCSAPRSGAVAWDGRDESGVIRKRALRCEVEAVDYQQRPAPATGAVEIDNALEFGDFGP